MDTERILGASPDLSEDEDERRDVRNKDAESSNNGTAHAGHEPLSIPLSDASAWTLSDSTAAARSNASALDGSTQPQPLVDMSLWKLFLMFLNFGLRAWGGPMAQIAMIKQHLVVEQQWITVERFNRVLAVYQVLPGPEATELCCYFGMIARGRPGSVVAGIGFIIPGFALMLLASWLYDQYGLSSASVNASFQAVKPVVCAMMFRAVHRIGEHSVIDHDTKRFSVLLFAICWLSGLQYVLRINFFLTLLYSGLVAHLWGKRQRAAAAALSLVCVAGFASYVGVAGHLPPSDFIGAGVTVGSNSLGGVFLLGLLAGLLTFGGAYTAVPFLRQSAVAHGAWMTSLQFIDGFAIASLLPAPLVIFSTFVGYMGAGIGGAILMTIGMFLPAFSFTLIGHNFFERLVNSGKLAMFLDGVTAAVVGLIGIAAWQLLRSSVTDPLGAVLFVFSLAVLYKIAHSMTSTVLVLSAAVVGQVLYGDLVE